MDGLLRSLARPSLVWLIPALLFFSQGASASQALVLNVDAAISPASADYIIDGIREAEQLGYDIVIIEMDVNSVASLG